MIAGDTLKSHAAFSAVCHTEVSCLKTDDRTQIANHRRPKLP
ncbi:hypothetical protein RBSH_06015 [Rhodopirellula baltica SH28]|uniref:Uncharacterized protein n=1 Tax=Rhodopirellula baltica SH28 TaxID=993517 RepID=K5D8C7_RHOBT|nr:hypothetical protein RBSH_06015 [Rhodopirellula baltica SH28]